MSRLFRALVTTSVLLCGLEAIAPTAGAAQEGEGGQVQITAEGILSAAAKTTIRDFYTGNPSVHGKSKVKPLPPGIRKNLARGKPLPPGIAKRAAPADLHSRIQIPAGYELVEVGLDVVLVDAATQVIHDVLMDVIR
jgi:hypothetical protein